MDCSLGKFLGLELLPKVFEWITPNVVFGDQKTFILLKVTFSHWAILKPQSRMLKLTFKSKNAFTINCFGPEFEPR